MAERVGRLKHPPLEYVIAAVRFQPLEALPRWIPDFQEALRERYPIFHKIRQVVSAQVVTMDVDPQSFDPTDQFSSWIFARADRSFIIQVSKKSISFQTRNYTTFKAFSEEVLFALERLLSFASYLDVTFMGIRYLDHLKPRPGLHLSSFTPSSLLPMPSYDDNVTLLGGLSKTVYSIEGDRLQVRLWTGVDQTRIPEDLFNAYVLSQDPKKLQEDGGFRVKMLELGEAMLDMDAVSEGVLRASPKEVVEIIDRLHSRANHFFRTQLSEQAFEQWQGAAS